jgi:excisionase family DNA binding protein
MKQNDFVVPANLGRGGTVSLIEERYVSVAKAAELLKVSRSTLWRWISQGDLPACRIGHRRVLIKQDDLNRLFVPVARKKGGTMHEQEPVESLKMSPTEAVDQLAVIERARALQERILARHGGALLPSSAEDLDELRDERSASL